MLERVRRTIATGQLLEPVEPVWVAVSGGVDSMVLLQVLLKLGHPCQVVHVEHGLRGEVGKADAEFVRQWCAQQAIPVQVVSVDVSEHRKANGGSIQMAARELRRAVFLELVAKGPHKIALGHHGDDAMETFFLHLMRGIGSDGWRSIAIRQGPIIRPLLEVRRPDILQFAFEHDTPFREDAGNRDPKYLRNRVRHEVLPLLEDLRAGSAHVMVRNLRLAREMDAAAHAEVERMVARLMITEFGIKRIPIDAVLASGWPRLILLHLLRGGGLHPDRLEDLLVAMERGHTGARFPGNGVEVHLDRGYLIMAPVMSVPRSWTIHSPEDAREGMPLRLTLQEHAALDITLGRRVAWMDADRVAFPLELRPWRKGDRMQPLGMKGSKLVSDLLVDDKVPLYAKPYVYVLEADGRIIWLCGIRLAEGWQASSATHTVLRADWLAGFPCG